MRGIRETRPSPTPKRTRKRLAIRAAEAQRIIAWKCRNRIETLGQSSQYLRSCPHGLWSLMRRRTMTQTRPAFVWPPRLRRSTRDERYRQRLVPGQQQQVSTRSLNKSHVSEDPHLDMQNNQIGRALVGQIFTLCSYYYAHSSLGFHKRTLSSIHGRGFGKGLVGWVSVESLNPVHLSRQQQKRVSTARIADPVANDGNDCGQNSPQNA